jgi:hypothetical protein
MPKGACIEMYKVQKLLYTSEYIMVSTANTPSTHGGSTAHDLV